jgi:hypothetical protein
MPGKENSDAKRLPVGLRYLRALARQLRARESSKDVSASVAPPLRDQIALLGMLVFFAGVVETEQYYRMFSLKYQSLSIPVSHLVYRGATAVLEWPLLVAPYFLALAWLLGSVRFPIALRMNPVPVVNATVLILVVVLTFAIAQKAGTNEAQADFVELTCQLPKIKRIAAKRAAGLDDGRYRLLTVTSDYVIMYQPLEQDVRYEIPKVKFIRKEDIDAIEVVQH